MKQFTFLFCRKILHIGWYFVVVAYAVEAKSFDIYLQSPWKFIDYLFRSDSEVKMKTTKERNKQKCEHDIVVACNPLVFVYHEVQCVVEIFFFSFLFKTFDSSYFSFVCILYVCGYCGANERPPRP